MTAGCGKIADLCRVRIAEHELLALMRLIAAGNSLVPALVVWYLWQRGQRYQQRGNAIHTIPLKTAQFWRNRLKG